MNRPAGIDSSSDAFLDPKRLIFVGGLHRSGTTPFARILGEHPNVSCLRKTGVIEDEGQHLQSVYPPGTAHGGSGHFARSPRAHVTENSPLVSAGNAQEILASWVPYWDLTRERLVEKSPPNLLMGRFLQALYPGAQFVMVLRHPITVALSTRKWTHFISRNPRKFATLSNLVQHWLIAHRLLQEDLPHLKSVHVVRYEELVQRPADTLERVRGFLGLHGSIPFDSVRASASDTYQETWSSYHKSFRPGGVQREIIARRFSSQIAEYGYDVDDLMTYEPGPSTLLP